MDMMYIVQIGNSSVCFPWKELMKAGHASQKTQDGTVEIKVKNFVPYSTKAENDEPLNGYFSYWFSWYSVKGEQGIVWDGK